MSKIKLSAVQRAVLERMAAGETITHYRSMGWFQDESARLTNTPRTVNLKTLDVLKSKGLVVFSGQGRTSSEYTITDNGRDALTEEAK